jgi:hypothetical protein
LCLDLKSTKKGCKKLSGKLTIVLLLAVAMSLSLASVATAMITVMTTRKPISRPS